MTSFACFNKLFPCFDPEKSQFLIHAGYLYRRKLFLCCYVARWPVRERSKAVSTHMWLEIGESGGTNVRDEEVDRRVGVSEDLRINPRRCALLMCV